ncbi:hypothetical protein ACQ4PT_070446 [Festuca glaucescens]
MPPSTQGSSPSPDPLTGAATSQSFTSHADDDRTCAATTTRSEEVQRIISWWERIARVPMLAELHLSSTGSSPEWLRLVLGEAAPVGASIEAMIFEEHLFTQFCVSTLSAFYFVDSFPYGQTYQKPTGRCSDGLLIIDYLAMALDLPLINPYLDKTADFSSGVNFAVAGATALDRTYLLQNAIIMPPGNMPLSSQLDWFKAHLNATCPSQEDCAKKLGGALFLVGEIGGNDYNYAFFQKRSIEAVKAYVPQVVNSIMDLTKEVIELGATQIIIPGNFPIGCSPSYLSLFSMAGSADHDERGCLTSYNSFAAYHNEQLKVAIDNLRKANADISIVYADYYGAFLHLLDHASVLGRHFQTHS